MGLGSRGAAGRGAGAARPAAGVGAGVGEARRRFARIGPTLRVVAIWTSRSFLVGIAAVAILGATTCAPPPTDAAPTPPPSEVEAPPRPIAAPAGATAPLQWYRATAPGGWLTFGRAEVPGAPVTVVHLHATGGLRHADEAFVAELAQRGIDAIAACWYEHPEEEVDCPNGPRFSGVSDAAAADVDALIASIRRLPELATRPIVVTGLSRGGGVALLRATAGAPEAAVAMNPLVVGSRWLDPEIDVDVDRRVQAGMSRSLVVVTDDDAFVPPGDQGLAFVDAARRAGAPVELLRRPDGAHGGPIFDPAVRAWAVGRVVAFAYSFAAPR